MGQRPDDTSDYEGLFLDATPLIDTRAPVEFARGCLPGAANLPLMSDEERAAVGTCYKMQGQEAAIALGHQLVSGERRAERLAHWRAFAESHSQAHIFCARGGMRSQIVQQWLRESGLDLPRIHGGYKSMRRFLLDTLEAKARQADLLLVAGATGTGKTRAVNQIPRAIDLEGLAAHRGSAFGHLLDPQPTQISFENALSVQLLRLARTGGPVVLEDEGRLIGRLALPETLRQRMTTAPMLVIEEPLQARVQLLFEDYILDLGERYGRRFGEEGAARHRERLLSDLDRIRKRLGGVRHKEVSALMLNAFEAQARSGEGDAHRAWIERLLVDYYDPMYAHQMRQRSGRRLFRGSRAAVIDFARERLQHATG